LKGVVFLDRDGTLIEEVGYIKDPADVCILPGAAAALRRLAAEGYLLAVASNQSGLARGKFTRAEMEAVNDAFLARFREEDVVFDAVEYCPHHPEGHVAEARDRDGGSGPAALLGPRIVPPLRGR